MLYFYILLFQIDVNLIAVLHKWYAHKNDWILISARNSHNGAPLSITNWCIDACSISLVDQAEPHHRCGIAESH